MLTDLSLVDEDIYNTNILENIQQNINFYFENKFNENLQLGSIVQILDYLEIKTFKFNDLFSRIIYLKDVINNRETKLEEIVQKRENGLFKI